MIDEILSDARQGLDGVVQSLKKDLAKIRAGRATPSILDGIMVEYYGTPTQLQQVASVNVPEPRLLVVQPFDATAMGAVEKAIRSADLGLSPMNDGKVIRVPIPDLTEERRKDLVRQARKETEKHRISARNHRRDGNDLVKQLLADKDVGEDDARAAQDKIQKLTDSCMSTLDSVLQAKEQDILAV